MTRQAVTSERLRIARELHDVVAHSMSVIAVQAGKGRMVLDRSPESARESLIAIETTSRAALAEMRRLLNVLRDDSSQPLLAPNPGMVDLDALVAETVASGLPVQVRIEGERVALPAGADLAAFRIVQEALTNVRRHAGRVARLGDRALLAHRADDRHRRRRFQRPGERPFDHGGHGLTGMRERAELYGGRVEVGHAVAGGSS